MCIVNLSCYKQLKNRDDVLCFLRSLVIDVAGFAARIFGLKMDGQIYTGRYVDCCLEYFGDQMNRSAKLISDVVTNMFITEEFFLEKKKEIDVPILFPEVKERGLLGGGKEKKNKQNKKQKQNKLVLVDSGNEDNSFGSSNVTCSDLDCDKNTNKEDTQKISEGNNMDKIDDSKDDSISSDDLQIVMSENDDSNKTQNNLNTNIQVCVGERVESQEMETSNLNVDDKSNSINVKKRSYSNTKGVRDNAGNLEILGTIMELMASIDESVELMDLLCSQTQSLLSCGDKSILRMFERKGIRAINSINDMRRSIKFINVPKEVVVVPFDAKRKDVSIDLTNDIDNKGCGDIQIPRFVKFGEIQLQNRQLNGITYIHCDINRNSVHYAPGVSGIEFTSTLLVRDKEKKCIMINLDIIFIRENNPNIIKQTDRMLSKSVLLVTDFSIYSVHHKYLDLFRLVQNKKMSMFFMSDLIPPTEIYHIIKFIKTGVLDLEVSGYYSSVVPYSKYLVIGNQIPVHQSKLTKRDVVSYVKSHLNSVVVLDNCQGNDGVKVGYYTYVCYSMLCTSQELYNYIFDGLMKVIVDFG
jgi:hypothetical protein